MAAAMLTVALATRIYSNVEKAEEWEDVMARDVIRCLQVDGWRLITSADDKTLKLLIKLSDVVGDPVALAPSAAATYQAVNRYACLESQCKASSEQLTEAEEYSKRVENQNKIKAKSKFVISGLVSKCARTSAVIRDIGGEGGESCGVLAFDGSLPRLPFKVSVRTTSLIIPTDKHFWNRQN
ncbi:unnamed protein product [Cyprideis torosa]|uniref:Uncharacterized protein n=1 Tax=Cyprideis torosa TaxID=163714 RepID=A0A7R8W445_9CRUS|nr:unnamed protein product [Cyprideis torosa]CAG0881535.1 unnamed protein product [Cyprideis torosa]